MKKISERLRMLRGDNAQVVAARTLGIAQQGWARYENGSALPGAEVIHRICCKFNVSADWLLGLSDERTGTAAPSVDAETVAQLAAKDAEIERLKGEVQGMRFALDALAKGAQGVPPTASHGQSA